MNLWLNKDYPIIISCAKELSRWTEREVVEMGYRPIETTENTVVVRGDMRDVMKLNLKLRTAHRVLVPLLRTRCRNIKEMYLAVNSIDWENLIEADGYISVSSVVHNNTIRDTRIPSLYAKDAVVDRIRDKCHMRPDSGRENKAVSPWLDGEMPPHAALTVTISRHFRKSGICLKIIP